MGAMAQELSLKTVTFLKPGQKATIAVGLKNSSAVDYVQARIALPEGLSFVEEEGNAKALPTRQQAVPWTRWSSVALGRMHR